MLNTKKKIWQGFPPLLCDTKNIKQHGIQRKNDIGMQIRPTTRYPILAKDLTKKKKFDQSLVVYSLDKILLERRKLIKKTFSKDKLENWREVSPSSL